MWEGQGRHLFLLVALLGLTAWASRADGMLDGSYAGLSTETWIWWSIAVPILHQVWVAVCWRLELHDQWLSRHLGDAGFKIYAAGFAFWSLGRFVTFWGLASANQGTLAAPRWLLNAAALALLVPTVYLFYSVSRYFGFRRALGADHFDPSYRTATLVKKGIFRFTNNGMYTFGFGILWVIGLLAASKATLLSAAFSHLYIWVHFFCTERPDMRRIYGGEGTTESFTDAPGERLT